VWLLLLLCLWRNRSHYRLPEARNWYYFSTSSVYYLKTDGKFESGNRTAAESIALAAGGMPACLPACLSVCLSVHGVDSIWLVAAELIDWVLRADDMVEMRVLETLAKKMQ
jgi:hypothetical protein